MVTKKFKRDPEKQEEEYQDTFELFDEDEDGYITKDELYKALRTYNIKITPAEVENAIEDLGGGVQAQLSFEMFKNILENYIN